MDSLSGETSIRTETGSCKRMRNADSPRASINDDRHNGSRQKTVLIVLSLHAALTLWNFPCLGQTGGPDPMGFYSYYLTYTSIPTIFVVPFLSQTLSASTAVTACLIVNGGCVAWLVGAGLGCLIYPRSRNLSRARAEAKERDKG